MPERYSEYDQRSNQGAYNNSNYDGARPTPQNAARPQGSAGQVRPASQARRPVQSAAGNMQRPVSGGQRPAGTNARPQGSAGQVRPASQARKPVQNTAGNMQRPVSGGQRPAGTNARPQGSAGQARPASRGTAPVRRPAQGSAAGRRTSSSTQQRRPGQYGAAPRTAQTNRRPQAAQRNTRAKGGSGYGYAGASKGGFGGMPPVTKAIFGVLCVALLVTICLAVTSKIRSNQPQPGISMAANTQQPASQETMQPTDVPQETEAPTAEPQISTTDEPVQSTSTGRTARIRTIGDVIISAELLDNAVQDKKNDIYLFSPLFELVGDVMADADWTMINIEATLRKHREYGYLGYPTICTPHSILEDLKAVGVDMLTMCNNHALDGYYDGLKMSLDYADAAGLEHVGAYRSQEEHDTPEVYDINGIQVGMLNYTQFTNGMASLSDEEATIYGMRLMDGADYEGDIADLKNAGAEFVIAIMHWGEEYERYPESSTKAVARRLVAAGADLVIGGHPHVVQPAEYITATQADGTENTALVIYSIGNFVSDHRHRNTAYTDNGVIFDFTLQENEAGEIELANPNVIPVYVWQSEDDTPHEYRAVPTGVYLDNPPAEMSASEYERMRESWNEIVDLMGGVIPVMAE